MLLALRLCLAPTLMVAVTWVGRRLGPEAAGLVAGFPLASGPIAALLVAAHGSAFGVVAARGVLVGVLTAQVFILAYVAFAPRLSWPGATAAATLAFLAADVAGYRLRPTAPLAVAGVAIGLVLVWLAVRGLPPVRRRLASAAPAWDLPLRVALQTALVFAVTGLAARLGPDLSGLAAPVPILSAVLAALTHRAEGPTSARRLLRGVVAGSFSFWAFFSTLVLTLGRLPAPAAFALAAAAAVALQFVRLRVDRRPVWRRAEAAPDA